MNYKYVKGAISPGQPADIYFYTDVDEWRAQDFLWEFDCIVKAAPSEIRIHINSIGGCAVEGIGVFSKIMDCPIHTVCINDGIAASIASIIWAAGKETYMKDYALLMIHNPFIDDTIGNDAEAKQIVEAFTKQLALIYKNRFNLSDEKVKEIMDGKDGEDGTFFTADEAVANGFLDESHIIKTPKAISESIAASLNGSKDLTKIASIMASAQTLEKSKIKNNAIIEKGLKNSNDNSKNKTMEKEWTVVATLLGMSSEKATEAAVTASIKDLKSKVSTLDKVTAELNETKKLLSTANTELAGTKASIENLTNDLEKAKANLKKYQDAEEAARTKAIEDMVEAAVNDCKIAKETKEDWLKMAKNDFETTKKVLDAIPAREQISKVIADNEGNKGEAKDGLKDAEAELQAKVDKVVGKDFQFRSINK